MRLLVQHEPAARALLFATFVAGLAAELVVTSRRGGLRRDSGSPLDRGTKYVLVLAMAAGIFAAVLIARAPALRAGANTWGTYVLGLAVLCFGIDLRVWAVWSLGRFFRREVTIEAGQVVHRSGPYRWVRHPAYAGDLLIVLGFGIAWGSWVGAAAGTAIALAGHLPRIRVEEAALEEAFGDEYAGYAGGRARLLPGVW